MSSSYFSYLRIFLLFGFIGFYLMSILSLTIFTELWNYNEFFFIAGSVFLVLFLLTHVMQYLPVTENEKTNNEESYGSKKRVKK